MRTLVLIIVSVIMILTASCTHNGGDIGLWGGTWHLERIYINGVENITYTGNVFWKFQSDVIDMVETDDEMHERQDHYGTWMTSDNDKTLTIDFSHGSDRFPAGSADYIPPAITGLRGGITQLEIEKLTGRNLVLRYDNDITGNVITFELIKQ